MSSGPNTVVHVTPVRIPKFESRPGPFVFHYERDVPIIFFLRSSESLHKNISLPQYCVTR